MMESVTEKVELQRYPEYKDSGVEWMGEIPENWQVLPGFAFLRERNEKNTGMKESQVLSLSYGNVIVKPVEKLTGLVPESFETYQLVYPGDIIIRPTDLQNDKTSLRTGIAKDKGIITSAYLNLRVNGNNSNKYYHYLLHAIDTNKVIYGLGTGLRQNLSYEDFKRFQSPVPPPEEQTAIAHFLDRKTEQIDQAIEIKQKQIELLKERRQILIHKAVTRGLNPNAPLKPSGVDWIGDIPEHWQVKKLKYLCVINQNSLPENYPKNRSIQYVDIGSVSFENGIEDCEHYKFSDAPSRARRIAKPGDTIISTVRTYLKAIDYINEKKAHCIFSTGFAVLTPFKNVYPKFLSSFVRSDAFTNQVQVNSKGMSYPAINSTDLSNLIVTEPTLNEQIGIVEFINEIHAKIGKSISNTNKEITKLKEYKTTLINSAVTGKIKVS